MDFGNVIFMTDLDGTLLTDDKRVLPRDMEAIERFRAGGGIFTAATGRGYSMTKPIAEKLSLDAPAVVFNGAAVYDFSLDRFLWQCETGPHAAEYIRRIAEQFPDIGVEVLHEKTIYVPYMSETEQAHLDLEGIIPDIRPLEEIPQSGWLKVLYAHEPDRMDRVVEFVQRSGMDNAQWVRSAPVYYECLPKGVDKSTGFAQLIRLLGAEERFTVAAGDYMNDMAMITRFHGCAVNNARAEVKAAAEAVYDGIFAIIDHIMAL